MASPPRGPDMKNYRIQLKVRAQSLRSASFQSTGSAKGLVLPRGGA